MKPYRLQYFENILKSVHKWSFQNFLVHHMFLWSTLLHADFKRLTISILKIWLYYYPLLWVLWYMVCITVR